MKFHCVICDKEFETNSPLKKDYTDYLIGSCWKYVSFCPSCGQESDEKRVPKPQKFAEPVTPQNYCGGGNCGYCG